MGKQSKQSKGGQARAAKMTPEQRQACAKKAAAARWGAPKNTRVVSGYEYEAFLLFERLENARAAIRHSIPLEGEGLIARIKALDEVYAEYTRDRAFLRHEWGLDASKP